MKNTWIIPITTNMILIIINQFISKLYHTLDKMQDMIYTLLYRNRKGKMKLETTSSNINNIRAMFLGRITPAV